MRNLTALVLAACLGGLACGPVPETVDKRVLLVGIDGATLRVAGPMMAAGKLPNLARIARAGASGPLRSFLPLHSPRIWNTIATGKIPRKHGILTFVQPDEKGPRRLYSSANRKTHALWNIASDAGLTVAVVNWWTTYPPEPINGVMVTDHFIPEDVEVQREFFRVVPDDPAPIVFPEPWAERVRDLVDIQAPLTSIEDPFSSQPDLPRWADAEVSSSRFRLDGAVFRIALEIESELEPDLLMVFIPGIDRTSHRLWGSLEPEKLYPETLRPSPAERKAGLHALHEYYRYADALIGLLVARYAEDDLVMVVSDHGFEAGDSYGTLTGRHETDAARDGVLFVRGRGIPAGSSTDSVTVNDITPTILAWLGLPVARDMDGRPMASLQVAKVEKIATYDTKPIARLESDSPAAEDEILEELRALGYLE